MATLQEWSDMNGVTLLSNTAGTGKDADKVEKPYEYPDFVSYAVEHSQDETLTTMLAFLDSFPSLCKARGVEEAKNAPYVRLANGLTRRLNDDLKNRLRQGLGIDEEISEEERSSDMYLAAQSIASARGLDTDELYISLRRTTARVEKKAK